MYRNYLKRSLDILVSFAGLLVLLPVFLLLVIVLTIAFKGNPFFSQLRPGKNERIFKLFKFKSMSNERNSFGELLPDSQRLTPIGKIVRKSSLDEIPQLLNVLVGDMSLVGPRPLLVKYLPYYNDTEKLRHSVRPGITGWAQVNGRNGVEWEERLMFDVYYVNHLSLRLDLTIIWRTFFNMIRRRGDNLVDPRSAMLDFDQHRLQTTVPKF